MATASLSLALLHVAILQLFGNGTVLPQTIYPGVTLSPELSKLKFCELIASVPVFTAEELPPEHNLSMHLAILWSVFHHGLMVTVVPFCVLNLTTFRVLEIIAKSAVYAC